jgi:ABC-type polysaccharide/polyol phosphate export permease
MITYLKSLFSHKLLVWQLSKKDIKSKYLGSYLGILWAFVQPSIIIMIYWFIFQVGFKSVPVENIPFILWFMAGIIPWFYFSDSISTTTYAILENVYLVKKIVFPIQLLSTIKIISSLFIHVFFLIILLSVYFSYGFSFSWYNLQVIYYSICISTLLLGLSWITSSLMVFLKDVGQIVNMLLQFFFWLTPILWDIKILPHRYEVFFKLNPLFYIIEGYRDSLFLHIGFWNHYLLTAYFWIFTLIVLFIGNLMFKKLRPHFADVL